MRKLFTAAAATAVLALSAGVANAATFFDGSFQVTSWNVSDPGLQISVAPSSGNLDFTMGDPSNVENNVSLFKIWTNETTVNPDDWNGKSITVNFTFTAPGLGGSGSVGGQTYGESSLTGFFQNGQVSWGADKQIDFGSFGVLNVHLDDAEFNNGIFWGLNEGKKHGEWITADFSLTPSAVPEPATWAMMITGFGLAGAALRRRRAAGAVAA